MNHFYIPFSYYIHSRLKNKTDVLSWLYIYPVFLLSFFYYYNSVSFLLLISFLSAFVGFFCLYETGYFENDIKTIKNEINPTLRLNSDEFEFISINYNKLVFSRFILFLFLSVIIYKVNGIDSFFIFFTISIFGRLFFLLHNLFRSRLNIITYFFLSLSKYSIIFYCCDLFNVDNFVFMILIFPLVRTIEHACKPKYNFELIRNIVGNNDLFRIKYYSLLFIISLMIGGGYIYFVLYFLIYRILILILLNKYKINRTISESYIESNDE